MKKALRIIGVVVVVAVIFAAIIASMNQKVPNSEKVWDEATTVGDMDASNYFVIYSDIACPYCVAFENAIVENEEEFERYLKQNDILLEVRLSDFLYEYGESRPLESKLGAEAIYCAKNEGKFWDYYNLAISKVWNEYFAASGKAAFSAFNKLGKDYWIEMGKSIGLGEDFENCVKNDDTLAEVQVNAKKASERIAGMPYFKFNSYTSSGFDLSWGWDYVLMYFESGLSSK